MSNPNQLFLLADHVKLSLLERQRAQTLNLDNGGGSGSQDGHIARSLEQFREGLTALSEEKARLEQQGDSSAASSIADSLGPLQKQLDDLTAQFHGFTSPSTTNTLTSPNDSSLAPDFAHATTTTSTSPPSSRKASKTVRFSDTPASPSNEQSPSGHHTDALFGPGRYRDDPSDSAGYRDTAASLDNEQLHAYHAQILDDQDDQLDRLGESIGRQRELSMQIGDELDSHVAMLDEVEGVTDRHISRLDRARKQLGKVARSAGENKQMTAIVVLIIVLVLLIAILK
ncbi:SNARE domain-containing protein [Sarocladium implicatum]|nr:SNARE domain-containing protein [Sarocladium implicatum]